MTVRHLHEHSVLDVCATLHGAFTGTLHIEVARVRELADWLGWRVINWDPPAAKTSIVQMRVEDTIHILACQVLTNAQVWLREREPAPAEAP